MFRFLLRSSKGYTIDERKNKKMKVIPRNKEKSEIFSRSIRVIKLRTKIFVSNQIHGEKVEEVARLLSKINHWCSTADSGSSNKWISQFPLFAYIPFTFQNRDSSFSNGAFPLINFIFYISYVYTNRNNYYYCSNKATPTCRFILRGKLRSFLYFNKIKHTFSSRNIFNDNNQIDGVIAFNLHLPSDRNRVRNWIM